MGVLIAKLIGHRAASRGHRLVVATVCMLLAMALPLCASAEQQAERERNEDAVLEIWPEAGDPQSIMGREIQRLLESYQARKDRRLELVTAPMWIASQAAANTERQRNPTESQQTAMRLYPELAVLDSPLNVLFRDTYGRFKEVKPEYFDDPRWPIKLAQQCVLQLQAQRAVGAVPAALPGQRMAALETTMPASPSDAAEVAPRPYRKWVVNGLGILVGAALVIAIIRYSLAARKRLPNTEEDGSSI